MGIREGLAQHRVASSVVAGIVILGAVVLVLREGCASSGGGGTARATRAYFSIDDGVTWFADDAAKLPPFQHEGKTAYRVKVFKCPSGPEFVSHLERYDEADKRRLEALRAKPPAPGGGGGGAGAMEQMALARAVEVKKPGDKNWIKWTPETAEQYQRAMHPKCPDGVSTDVRPVVPQ